MNRDVLDPKLLSRFPKLAELADTIGNTHLLEVPNDGGARIFAKCEWENPNGSIKDRTAFAMIYALIRDAGEAAFSKPILEYSGGSLGVSLSAMCQQLKLKLHLVLPTFIDPNVSSALEEQGTTIHWVPKEEGFWAVMVRAREIAAGNSSYAFLDQHNNRANYWIHEITTGREIIHQMERVDPALRVESWVASIGTGGTLMGCGAALKKVHPNIEVIATNPAELPYGSRLPPNGLQKFAGSGGLGLGRKQPLVARNESLISEHVEFSYSQTLAAMREFYSRTGIFIGSSAAANWCAARKVARRFGVGGAVVTVFPGLPSTPEIEKIRKALEPNEVKNVAAISRHSVGFFSQSL